MSEDFNLHQQIGVQEKISPPPQAPMREAKNETVPEFPIEVSYQTCIFKQGFGLDSRSYRLSQNGLYVLQSELSDFFKKNYSSDNLPKTLNESQLKTFIGYLESKYKDVRVGERTEKEWFYAAAARLYRAKAKEAEVQPNNSKKEISSDMYSLFFSRKKTGSPHLNSEGRAFIDQQKINNACFKDGNDGELARTETEYLIAEFKTNSLNKDASSEEKNFNRLAAKSLEWQLKRQEDFSFTESMRVSNSPWNQVADLICSLPQYENSNLNRSFAQELMMGQVKEIFQAIEGFSSDELEKSSITHTFAEQLCESLKKNSKNNVSLKERFDLAIRDMAEKNETTSYDQLLDVAICKSRYMAEMPQFMLDQQQAELGQLSHLLDGSEAKQIFTLLAKVGNEPITQKAFLEENSAELSEESQELLRFFTNNSPQFNKTKILPSGALEESAPTVTMGEKKMSSDLQLLTQYLSMLGDEFTHTDIISMISNLNEQRSSLQTQYDQDKIQHDQLLGGAKKIQDRYSLASELNVYWEKSGVQHEDRMQNLSQAPWLDEVYGKYIQAKKESIAVQRLQENKRLGKKESKSKILNWIKGTKKIRPIEKDRLIKMEVDRSDWMYFNSNLQKIFGIDLSHESENHKWLKRINVARVFFSSLSVFAGLNGFKTNASEANLKSILEEPTLIHSQTNPFQEVKDFFSGLFDLPTGFGVKGITNDNSSTSHRLSQLENSFAVSMVEKASEPQQENQEMSEVNKKELSTVFEFLLGRESGIHKMVVDARIQHLENLQRTNPEQAKLYVESIGGIKELESGEICIGIIGEDKGGAVGQRSYPYGHADQAHVLCYEPESNKLIDVSFPRYLILPENDGYDITQATWRDNPESASGRTTPQGLNILRESFVHSTGMPIDGVISFGFDSASSVINMLFPDGVDYTIGEGEGFVPQGENLGKLSGYTTGGYVAFEEGKSYHFEGSQIVDFMRSRFTSENGSYDREARAGGVMNGLLKIVFDNMKRDPASTLLHLSNFANNLEELEDENSIRFHSNLSVKDPDPEDSGKESQQLGDIMEVITESLLQPKNMGAIVQIVTSNVPSTPTIEQYSIGPSSEHDELKTAHPSEEFSGEVPRDSLNIDPTSNNIMNFWKPIREFLKERISNPSSILKNTENG